MRFWFFSNGESRAGVFFQRSKTRRIFGSDAAMWRVDADVARVRVLGGAEGVIRVASGPVDAGAAIPADPESEGRQLVLAEHANPGWRATLAGGRHGRGGRPIRAGRPTGR